MEIAIIAAMGENRVIGNHGTIPWHLPADFKHFKEITMGHPVLMGRKTFESIGKPLPGRMNIVITRDEGFAMGGVTAAHSLEAAIAIGAKHDSKKIFIIGGGQIYERAMAVATAIYLTVVHGTFEGDVLFPEMPAGQWSLVSTESHAKDEKNAYDFDFLVYKKSA
ncbi:MAG TPA: dihydrofolate reductase [Candidatus Paceibacterota bacterium]|nr:dihydrofolate reductase [Candidatus Paceibacterota bacterium]